MNRWRESGRVNLNLAPPSLSYDRAGRITSKGKSATAPLAKTDMSSARERYRQVIDHDKQCLSQPAASREFLNGKSQLGPEVIIYFISISNQH